MFIETALQASMEVDTDHLRIGAVRVRWRIVSLNDPSGADVLISMVGRETPTFDARAGRLAHCLDRPEESVCTWTVGSQWSSLRTGRTNRSPRVIETMPRFVDDIIVVDDFSPSPDRTCEIVSELATADTRITLIKSDAEWRRRRLDRIGYERASELRSDVVCVMAGDGQMDPDDLHRIVHPVASGRADYAKANRLTLQHDLSAIPRPRLVGNMFLSFFTRFATGYWTIGDAQTGFTAASSALTRPVPPARAVPALRRTERSAAHVRANGARVEDVPTKPRYAIGEVSKMRPGRVALPIAYLLFKGFWKRIFVRYVLLEANPVPLAYVAGLLGFLLGSVWSIILVARTFNGAAAATEVIAASTLFIGGAILLVLAVVLDVLFSLGLSRRKDDWVEAPDPDASPAEA